jgi:hypothetical protein
MHCCTTFLSYKILVVPLCGEPNSVTTGSLVIKKSFEAKKTGGILIHILKRVAI